MRQEPPGFEALWKAWLPYARKTDGRGKARPTYIKWLEAGADPQDMIDGAQWHLRSLSERDRPYINLLSVYLNSERWADECEQERAFQKKRAEQEERRGMKPAPNVVQIETHRPTRPSEAERARHAADLLSRLGIKQAAE